MFQYLLFEGLISIPFSSIHLVDSIFIMFQFEWLIAVIVPITHSTMLKSLYATLFYFCVVILKKGR